MKNIISKVQASVLPNMIKKIQHDLYDFYYQHKNYNFSQMNKLSESISHNNFGHIYFMKNYTIDLFGWSGLANWYKRLIDRKNLNTDINLFKNIYLDPTLCLRNIQDNKQCKQLMRDDFWEYNKNKLQEQNKLKLTVLITEFVDNRPIYIDSIGKYQQQYQVISIQWSNDFNQIKKTLVHQFVHFLDHLTALTLKQNIKKLKNYKDISLPEDSNQQLYTKDKKHNVDIDNDSGLQNQYQPSYQTTLMGIKNDIIEDAIWGFQQYYIDSPQLLIYFCYLFEYNVKKNQPITRLYIQNQLKEENKNNIIQVLKYLSNFSSHKFIRNKLNKIKLSNIRTYKQIMKRFYLNLKKIYLVDTQLSNKIF